MSIRHGGGVRCSYGWVDPACLDRQRRRPRLAWLPPRAAAWYCALVSCWVGPAAQVRCLISMHRFGNVPRPPQSPVVASAGTSPPCHPPGHGTPPRGGSVPPPLLFPGAPLWRRQWPIQRRPHARAARRAAGEPRPLPQREVTPHGPPAVRRPLAGQDQPGDAPVVLPPPPLFVPRPHRVCPSSHQHHHSPLQPLAAAAGPCKPSIALSVGRWRQAHVQAMPRGHRLAAGEAYCTHAHVRAWARTASVQGRASAGGRGPPLWSDGRPTRSRPASPAGLYFSCSSILPVAAAPPAAAPAVTGSGASAAVASSLSRRA